MLLTNLLKLQQTPKSYCQLCLEVMVAAMTPTIICPCNWPQGPCSHLPPIPPILPHWVPAGIGAASHPYLSHPLLTHPITYLPFEDLQSSRPHFGEGRQTTVPQHSWAAWLCLRIGLHFQSDRNTLQPCWNAAMWPRDEMVDSASLKQSAQPCRELQNFLQHCTDCRMDCLIPGPCGCILEATAIFKAGSIMVLGGQLPIMLWAFCCFASHSSFFFYLCFVG